MFAIVIIAACLAPAQGLRKALVNEFQGKEFEGKRRRQTEPNTPSSAWFTGPWGDCARACGPAKFRTVECRDVYGGQNVEDAECAGKKKPGNSIPCDCGSGEACKLYESFLSCPAKTEGDGDTTGIVEVGCFFPPRPTVPKSGTPESAPPYAMDCYQWQQEGKCAGGLPFYQLSGQSSMDACSKFCLEKGLDVFGLETGAGMCRCGAGAANEAVWKLRVASGLVFDPTTLSEDPKCALKVARYGGFYEDGAIPATLRPSTNQADTEYVETVAAGQVLAEDEEGEEAYLEPSRRMGMKKEADGAVAATKVKSHARAGWWDPSWKRNCYPDQCAEGSPWNNDRTYQPLAGRPDRYEYYTRIPYYFDPWTIDAKRKQVVRAAARIWAASTCINFVEIPAPYIFTSFVKVTVKDLTSCSVNPVGEAQTDLNLGWCNSISEVGSVVHELGHVLGMNHEQKRPDAQATYHGKGPYLKMKWSNIASDAKDQWKPAYDSYTGSANDGSRDPFNGYASYDFASIMQYSAGDGSRFDTVPASSKSLTGQRTALSSGDISQVNDMYQCKRCTPDKKNWRDAVGSKCTGWRGYDCTSDIWLFQYTPAQLQAVQTNCRKSCGLC